jgi:ABC-type glutathione transport system ATPase component
LEADPILRVRGLRRTHRPRRRGGAPVAALAGVDLDVRRGRALAVVGLSGAGKSTLARCLARLEDADGGEILFDGRDVAALRGPDLRAFRERVQLVQQDSAAALDPLFTALESVREPLAVARRGTPGERTRLALELMELVALDPSHAARLPAELSGGQRQRVAIARALALAPEVLILDEAFTGLDVTVQAALAALLADLRQRLGLTLVAVSHDLALMASLADDVAVIASGRVAEAGEAAAVLAAPRHPETRALVGATVRLPPLEAGGR